MTRPPLPLVAAVLMATASAAVAGPIPAQFAPLVWAAAWWLPGLAVAPRGRSFFDPATHLVALGAGPLLFGAGFCLGRLAGLPLSVSALIAIWIGGLVASLRWSRAVADSADRSPEASSGSWMVALVGLGILLFAAWPPIGQEAMRLRDDARLHLPITLELLRGSFPPGNPFLAGEPLAYFWFYHTILAGMASLVRIPLEFIPVGLSLHALGVLLATLDWTGRRFGLPAPARAFALGALAFGLSPQGWMHLATLHLTRPDINWPLFAAEGSFTLFPVLGQGDPRLAAFLTKIAVTNAFPLGLACFLLALAPLGGGLAGGLRQGIFVAGALGAHLVTGVLLVAGLLFREVLVLAGMGAPRERGAGTVDRSLILALGLAGLATGPYVISILAARSGSGAATLVWQPLPALSMIAALAGLALLAGPALARWIRTPETRFHLAAGLPALALPFAVHLVDGNEYKSVFVLAALLALPAASGALSWVRQRVPLLPLLLLPFLPNSWMAAHTYARETPPRIVLGTSRTALQALGESIPAQGVVWKAHEGIGYSTLTLDLARRSYLSDPYALQILGQWESGEARLRREVLATAQRGRARDALLEAAKRVAPNPVWVVVSATDASRFPWLVPQLSEAGYVETGRAAGISLMRPPPRGNEP